LTVYSLSLTELHRWSDQQRSHKRPDCVVELHGVWSVSWRCT